MNWNKYLFLRRRNFDCIRINGQVLISNTMIFRNKLPNFTCHNAAK